MDPIYPLDNILSLYQDKQKVILTYLPNQTSLKLHNFRNESDILLDYHILIHLLWRS